MSMFLYVMRIPPIIPLRMYGKVMIGAFRVPCPTIDPLHEMNSGITCYSGRVTGVELSGVGLNCTENGLPTSGFPEYVETLDFQNELLTGPLSVEMFKKRYLNKIWMANAGLWGEIPEEVGLG